MEKRENKCNSKIPKLERRNANFSLKIEFTLWLAAVEHHGTYSGLEFSWNRGCGYYSGEGRWKRRENRDHGHDIILTEENHSRRTSTDCVYKLLMHL